MNRGLRNIDFAVYGQDEWRVTPRLTLNYGLRWEVSTPFVDIRNRMNSWSPGKQSTVFPNAPQGCCFPAIPGVPDGIAPVYWKGLMPRLGLAWDPTGSGKTSIRAAYGIFYDSLHQRRGRSAAGAAERAALDAGAAAASAHRFHRSMERPESRSPPNSFPQPTTVLTVENGMRPPYSQNWNFSIQRSFGERLTWSDVRYIGNKGTRLPRMIEANPAIYRPGATSRTMPTSAGCTPAATARRVPATLRRSG